jgi:signal transduction histidine kinase
VLALRLGLSFVASLDGGTLRTIEDVLALLPEEAAKGFAVELEGTVTYADPLTRDFFIESSSGAAISMWYPDAGVGLRQGDRISLRGVTAPGDYAPKVEPDPSTLRLLERNAALPRSRPTQADLRSGRLDCRSIEIEGLVRDAHILPDHIQYDLLTLFGPTRLLFPRGVRVENPRALVGAEIRARSTVGTDTNSTRQRTGLRLYSAGLSEVQMTDEPLPNERLPRCPLKDLLTYESRPHADPRVLIAGTTTYASGHSGIIEHDGVAVRIELASGPNPSPLKLSESIEAACFVEVVNLRPALRDCEVLRRTPVAPVKPRVVEGTSLFEPSLDDVLVQVTGQVKRRLDAPFSMLSIDTERGPVVGIAFERARLTLPEDVEPEAVVSLTGVKTASTEQVSPVVMLRNATDVTLVRTRPFWTTRLASAIALTLSLILFFALGLIAWLRSIRKELTLRVEQRTTELAASNASLAHSNEALSQYTRTLELQREELIGLHHVRARFITTLAHDIRTPLSVVVTAAEYLRHDDSARERKLVAEDILASGQRINAYVTDLVTRYRDETVRLRQESFDVRVAVRRAMDQLRGELSNRQQSVEFEERAGPSVRGDSVIFEQVVVNLVLNASRHGPKGAVIRLSWGERGVLEIGDTTDQTSGDPLDDAPLALSQRWIQAMEGRLWRERAGDQRTRFFVELPFAQAANVGETSNSRPGR